MKTIQTKYKKVIYSSKVDPKTGKYSYKYLGKVRPSSIILVGNSNTYNLLSRNCMHVSVEALQKGTLSKNNNKFQRVLKSVHYWHLFPNNAYWDMCDNKLHAKEFKI